MRKSKLIELLKPFSHLDAFQMPLAVFCLYRFLNEKPYQALAEVDDIRFKDFSLFLAAQGLNLNATMQQHIRDKGGNSDLLFSLFIEESLVKVKENKTDAANKAQAENKTVVSDKSKSLHDKIPGRVLDNVVAGFLDATDVGKLASTSKLFSQNVKAQKGKRTTGWKEKFINLVGLDAKVVEKVLSAKVIHDYNSLYHALLKVAVKARVALQPWEIFCLSGEVPALQHAVKHEGLTALLKSSVGSNALHFAAQSGSLAAMRFCVETLNIPADSKNDSDMNALHFAGLSDSIAAMHYCVQTLKIPADSKSNTGCNALHFAAYSRSLEGMRYCVETLKIPANSKDAQGSNTLLWAAFGGSIEAMDYCVNTLKIPADSKSTGGTNVLHLAAQGGSIAAMRYCVDTLMIPVDSKTVAGLNALHWAAFGGSLDAVIFLRQCSYKKGLNLTPDAKDDQNLNTYADQSGNGEKIKAILKLPIDQIMKIDLNSPSKDEMIANLLAIAAKRKGDHEGAPRVTLHS